MIKTYRNKRTEAMAKGKAGKGMPADVLKVAARKFRMINAAAELNDLRSPPKNHLEALKDDRTGQHSIRVNDKWRICFVWRSGDAYEVEFTDYH